MVVLHFFDPKQLLRVFCILWCYFSKCYSTIHQNTSLWCSFFILSSNLWSIYLQICIINFRKRYDADRAKWLFSLHWWCWRTFWLTFFYIFNGFWDRIAKVTVTTSIDKLNAFIIYALIHLVCIYICVYIYCKKK